MALWYRTLLCLALISVCAAPLPGWPTSGSIELVSSQDLLGSSFGYAVALDGTTLAVGAPTSSEGGAVYVFEQDQGNPERWKKLARLTGTSDRHDEFFGGSLDLDGDVLVVGAPRERTGSGYSGAVYVFYRNARGRNRWGKVQRLTAEDSSFGRTVAVSGDSGIATADYQVHALERDRGGPNRWYGVRLSPSRPFGREIDVALCGNTLAVGSEQSPDAGGILVFDREPRDSSGWREVRRLGSPTDSSYSDFGRSLALDGSTLAAAENGALYLFERNRNGRNRWGRRAVLDTLPKFPASPLTAPLGLRGNTVLAAGRYEGVDHVIRTATFVFERHSGGRNRWGAEGRLQGDSLGAGRIGGVGVGARLLAAGFPDRSLHTGLPDRVLVYRRTPVLLDGFESLDFSQWSQAKGQLAIVRPGLAGSEHALEVTLDGTRASSYLLSRAPQREPFFSVGVTLLVNQADLGSEAVEILRLAGGRPKAMLMLEGSGGAYWLTLWSQSRGQGVLPVGSAMVPGRRETRLVVEWGCASGPQHQNGFARLLIDGRVKAERRDLSTEDWNINSLRVGVPDGSPGAYGSLLMDDFALER